MMKKFLLIMLLGLISVLSPRSTSAEVVLPTDFKGSLPPLQSMIDPIGVRDTTYFKICQIRLMFCKHRKAALVIIAAVIFSMGMLVLIGKAKWQYMVVTSVGMVVFLSAEFLVRMITSPPGGAGLLWDAKNIGVVWACTCII